MPRNSPHKPQTQINLSISPFVSSIIRSNEYDRLKTVSAGKDCHTSVIRSYRNVLPVNGSPFVVRI